VNNPTDDVLTLEVTVDGHGLTGAPTLVVAGQSHDVYNVTFAPTAVGQFNGRSVINVYYRVLHCVLKKSSHL